MVSGGGVVGEVVVGVGVVSMRGWCRVSKELRNRERVTQHTSATRLQICLLLLLSLLLLLFLFFLFFLQASLLLSTPTLAKQV